MKKYLLFFILAIWFVPDCRGADEGAVHLPIIMYHNVSKNQGKLGKYVITPAEFESDLMYIKEQGYNTVHVDDIIGFVYNGTPLPENPVMLTFDDGDFSIERYVLPLLEKYEMKAVVSIIGKVTDRYSAEQRTDIIYPNLTWKQINKLLESGYIEIQNHTYDMHKDCGVKQKSHETDDAYKKRLGNDLQKMNDRVEEMTTVKMAAIVFPFGNYSANTNRVVKELGFAASMNCREKINILGVGNIDCLYGLGRFLRPHGCSVQRLLS